MFLFLNVCKDYLPESSPEHKVVENYLVQRQILFYGFYLFTD